MSLSAITSQYNGLNGLTGVYGYGTSFTGGLYSNANVETAKTGIANAYDLSATSTSYANKGAVSSSSFAQQCQAIEYLLQNGRTDDAMKKYDSLYDDMASNSYYQGYTENEIKTLLQEKYLDATGTTVVNDITANSNSAFTASFESSIPILGMLCNNKSSDDFISEATGTPVSGWSHLKSGLGVATGVAVSAGAGAGIKSLLTGLKSLKSGEKFTSGSKPAKIAAAVIAGGAALVTFIAGKIAKSND